MNDETKQIYERIARRERWGLALVIIGMALTVWGLK